MVESRPGWYILKALYAVGHTLFLGTHMQVWMVKWKPIVDDEEIKVPLKQCCDLYN